MMDDLEAQLLELIQRGQLQPHVTMAGVTDRVHNYLQAANKGLLKIMSKMGISVISSYRGGGFFEALGLSRTMVGNWPGALAQINVLLSVFFEVLR